MSVSEVRRERPLAPVSVMIARLAASLLRVRDRNPPDRLREDLERIAVCAPHLLIDIGFIRDAKASSSVETIWYKGSLRVAISSRDGSVSVLQR